ncbi:unnamed protein product, partial [Symbiodinium sp. KB8]
MEWVHAIDDSAYNIPGYVLLVVRTALKVVTRIIVWTWRGFWKGMRMAVASTLGTPNDIAAYVLILVLFVGLLGFVAFFAYQCFVETSQALSDTRQSVHSQLLAIDTNFTTGWQKWVLSGLGSVEGMLFQGMLWINKTWPEGSGMVTTAWDALKEYNRTIHGVMEEDEYGVAVMNSSAG